MTCTAVSAETTDSSNFSATVMSAAEARRAKKGAVPAWKVSTYLVSMNRAALREGAMFISERRLRMARISSMMRSISAASAAKDRASL